MRLARHLNEIGGTARFELAVPERIADEFSMKVLGSMQLLQNEASQLPIEVENSICSGMSRLSA
jgi:hypothetical protein